MVNVSVCVCVYAVERLMDESFDAMVDVCVCVCVCVCVAGVDGLMVRRSGGLMV